MASGLVLNEVEQREEQNPDDVYEVPIDRCCLNHVVVLCRELAKASAV